MRGSLLRLAAATARAQLLGAASLRWKLPVAELDVDDGVVSHASGPARALRRARDAGGGDAAGRGALKAAQRDGS